MATERETRGPGARVNAGMLQRRLARTREAFDFYEAAHSELLYARSTSSSSCSVSAGELSRARDQEREAFRELVTAMARLAELKGGPRG